MLNKQIAQVEKEMQELMETDPEFMQKMDYLISIPGISLVAAATVIGETLGFKDITSAIPLASHLGYDAVLRESGTMKGKSKISKKGNHHIRAVLHMPSMTAVRCNPTLKPFYQRLRSTKSTPIIGQVATQGKLLLLMYALEKVKPITLQFIIKKNSKPKELAAQDSY
ncbi:IS110 family transposase [Robertkochia marina]|uniref:IS110 family transposase n=1 Tax=Robertkochia marina TaxID=1227945 RepID=A0A4S3M0U6_9FLAO|nr:transposase [Robertkochia marina]THD67633.1 IS110 family transposase [Robertkochia marina]TRZ43366.1 IS110 family transposase [Robertkochia marina]